MSDEQRQRSRWWRRGAWALLALVILTIVALAGLEVAVRQPGVRKAIRERVEREVADRTGLSLQLDDLRLSLWSGSVELEGVTVGNPGESPILEIERVEAEWRLSSIWDRPFTLQKLAISRPEVDLEAPLPVFPTGSTDEGADLSLVIEHFRLADGRLDGPVLPVELESWIDDWWLQDLRIEGNYGPQTLDLALGSVAHWVRSDDVQVEAAVEGRLQGPQRGPWQLSELTLRSEGIQGSMTVTLGPGDTDPLQGIFDFEIEPHLLIPLPPSPGPVLAKGNFDVRQESGNLQLTARGLPAELAMPWLSSEILDAKTLEGWQLDLDANLALAGLEGGPSGMTRIGIQNGETTWISGEIELAADGSVGGVNAKIGGQLLPNKPGVRTMSALLAAPAWDELDQLTIRSGEIAITDTNLSDMRSDLAAVWPGPLPESIDQAMTGRLEAVARVDGPIARPQADLKANWKDGGETWVEIRASGNADGVFVESVDGVIADRRFRGRGSLELPTPISVAEIHLEIEQPAPEVESAILDAQLDKGIVTVALVPQTSNGVTSRIQADLPLQTLASVPEVGDAVAKLPIAKASGPLRVAWQIPEAEWGELIAKLGKELPLSVLSLGSTGSLAFDPTRPLAGTGELVVNGLEVATQDLQVASDGPVTLRLRGGELILEPARFSTEGGTLEAEVWSEMVTDWQPGSPLNSAIRRFRVEANGNTPLTLLSNFIDDVYTDGDLQVAVSVAGTPESLIGEARVLGEQASAHLGSPDGLRLSDPRVEIAFEDELVRINQATLGVEAGEVTLTGEVPLSTLLAMRTGETRDSNAELEPLRLRFEVESADWTTVLDKLGIEEPPEILQVGGRAELEVDPGHPLQASGWMEIEPLLMTTGDHSISSVGPIRLELDAGRLEVAHLELTADDQPFAMTGWADLDSAWTADQPITSLVESTAFVAEGTLAAALLNPFLAGGSAEGLLHVDLEIGGSLDDPTGRVRIDGPEASVLYLAPYVAKIEAPELDLELVDGRAQIRDGRFRLNDGDVELEGSLGLDGADVMAAYDGVRFRLDHGVLVKVDGELNLTVDEELRGRLTGAINVDQGSLTRPITIDRDLIADLLTPIDLTGTEANPLEQIDLDLRLETRRGVRVRNNVADLAVRWNGVRVRGNLLQPVVDGRFVVDPGGRAFLFGQTLRVDKGVLTFPGQPGAEAVLDLETTSSLDDPSISRLAGEDILAATQLKEPDEVTGRAEQAGWNAAGFVGEKVATRINEAVPGARFTFRPILIFGEADPGARLTLGRDFSRYVTLAASLDLRNAERQTYLMDAHSIPGLPGLTLQVFTNDMEEEGATLQHRLRFGSYRRTAPTGPTVRRVEIDGEVPEISGKALRRAVGLSKGERATPDDLFLAEVEVTEFLRRAGYPDARVELESQPVPERPAKVDIEVSIIRGPFVRFQFEGEILAKSLQRSITPIYRTDFYEPVALEEMRTQTVRALRSLGFLDPKVEIEVGLNSPIERIEGRTVTIRTQGGEQADVEELQIEGLSEADAKTVQSSFSTRLQRVELAAGEAFAEGRLLSAIRGLGYPTPEITDRNLSSDGRILTVDVEPGALRYLDEVLVVGIDSPHAEQLRSISKVEPGEVARRDRIAQGAMEMESDLQARGYRDARVQPSLEVRDGEGNGSISLIYTVEPGSSLTVAEARVEGVKSTSRRWATNVAEMESGSPLREDEVAAARSRLYDTGLFTMVGSETILTEGNRTEVIFDVEERPRYSVAYGFRWDNADGTQGVFDAIDGNFLGRGVTLGLRALYAQDDWSIRLGGGVPRLFGTRAVLELFASYRDLYDEFADEFTTTLFDEKIIENSIQIAYPFGDWVFGRVYGRYRTSDLQVTEIDEDPIFPLPPFDSTFSFKTPLIGTLWTFDSRDRALVLTRGYFGSLDLSGTGEFLNSDFEYLRMFSQFNLYRPVGRWARRGFSWAQSVRVGLADSFDQELDRNDRFFAGGQYSVRGYPTDSLGPVEQLGDEFFRPLGGKTLLVINEELRFDLLGPVAGVAFFDLGNVWEDTAEFSSDLFKSLGIGLRAVTPLGLLRLDYAFPLDRREEDPSSKLYFGFGNTF